MVSYLEISRARKQMQFSSKSDILFRDGVIFTLYFRMSNVRFANVCTFARNSKCYSTSIIRASIATKLPFELIRVSTPQRQYYRTDAAIYLEIVTMPFSLNSARQRAYKVRCYCQNAGGQVLRLMLINAFCSVALLTDIGIVCLRYTNVHSIQDTYGNSNAWKKFRAFIGNQRYSRLSVRTN